MANQVATGQVIPEGVNRANRFTVKSVVPDAVGNTETFTVTLPDGVPKDALPVGPPMAYTLTNNVYTRDAGIGVVTSHNRVTGVTVYTAASAVAAGTIVLQDYIGHG